MSVSSIIGVQIAGIASAVPRRIVETTEYAKRFGVDEVGRMINGTGVKRHRSAPKGMCTSDLCFSAGEKLLSDLGWERESVDAVIFVSQTADHLLPASACLLQHRWGLQTSCAAFDVSLGCSGYVYGLWLAAHLVASGASKRCLLAVGEVSGLRINQHDRSAVSLFGDAGTVTALSPHVGKDATPWHFVLGTDGSGGEHLVVPAGGCRLLPSDATSVAVEGDDGNIRSLNDLFMNGAEIFLFTLKCVPTLLSDTERAAGWSRNEIDYFVFHQANEFMLKHLAKKTNIPLDRLPLVLEDFGNTSSASIPLTMTEKLSGQLRDGGKRLLLAGFGVGLSWAAVALRPGPMVISSLVEVDESAIPEPLWRQTR